jgi:CheY-like chemotaxis protein
VLLNDPDEAAETMFFRAGAQDVLSRGEAEGQTLLGSVRAAMERQAHLVAFMQSLHQAQTERVVAMGRRAAAAAHDIDNPASFILANQSMLKDDLVKLGIVFASLRGYMAEEADSDRRAILDSVLPREALDNILRDMKEMLDDNNIGLNRIRALTGELRTMYTVQEEQAPAQIRKSSAPRSRAKILIVDDEPSLLKVYRRMLEPLHEVVTAHGGAEALAILTKIADFDVVVCDLTMPELDGPAIHRAVRTSSPELAERFVFCTGGAFTPQTREFIANVDNLFLEKPITREKLLAAVDRVRGAVVAEATPHSSAPPSG